MSSHTSCSHAFDRFGLRRWLVFCLVATATFAQARAESGDWDDRFFGDGADGAVYATAVDDDGNLYIGGDFTQLDSIRATDVAKWDGTSWSSLGNGELIGSISSLIVTESGTLVTADRFRVFAWDGTAWNELAEEADGSPSGVRSIVEGAGGILYAAGNEGLFEWNGTSWNSLKLPEDTRAGAIALSPDGELYLAGTKPTAQGGRDDGVYMRDGTGWTELSGNFNNGGPVSLTVAADGTLLAGGFFDRIDDITADSIAAWDGSSWAALGEGLDGHVQEIKVSSNGDIHAVGQFGSYDTGASNVAVWDGNQWQPVGAGVDYWAFSLTIDENDNLYVGGAFQNSGDVAISNIAIWDGISWSEPSDDASGAGVAGRLNAIATDSTGKVVVGGTFVEAGGVTARNIAEWDGSNWAALGAGSTTAVRDVAIGAGGEVYALGRFSDVGGKNRDHVGIWNGSSWRSIYNVINAINAIATSADGTLYAAGRFGTENQNGGVDYSYGLARWNGSEWTVLAGGLDRDLFSVVLEVESNDSVYLANDRALLEGVAGSRVIHWNGEAFVSLGSGVEGRVKALAVSESGLLHAGGQLENVGSAGSSSNVATWDGTAWNALDNIVGRVNTMLAMPDGKIYVGGSGFVFEEGDLDRLSNPNWIRTSGVVALSDGSWSALSSGVNEEVLSLATASDGSLYASGQFSSAGERASRNIARWTRTELESRVADVSISLTTDYETISRGDLFDAEVVIFNSGPDVANDVSLEISIPVSINFSSRSYNCSSVDEGVVRCRIGTVLSGQSARVTLAMSASWDVGSYDHVFSVSAAEADPDMSDNAVVLTIVTDGGDGPPIAATLVSPTGTEGGVSPTFRWNAADSSTWYRLYVNGRNGVIIDQWYRAADVGCDTGGVCQITPSLTVPVGPAAWWVQTYNAVGTGPWSQKAGFNAPSEPPGAATPVSPTGTDGGAGVPFTWNPVPGSSWYMLYVRDAADVIIDTWFTSAEAGCEDDTGTCAITPDAEIIGSATWWVRTYNEVGNGPWSAGLGFNLPTEPPPAAIPLVPSGSGAGTEPDYTWERVPESTWYKLYVQDRSGLIIDRWFTSAQAGCSTGDEPCSLTPAQAVSGAATWWVRTYNDAGAGPWNDPGLSFTP